MHFSTATTPALLTLLAASAVSAEELNSSDVPTACSAICAPIVTLTSICDVDPATEGSNRLLSAQLSSSNVMDKGGEKRSLHKRGRLTSSGALASSFEPTNGRKEKRGRLLLSTGELADAFEAKNGRKQKRGRLMSSGTLSSAFESKSGEVARMVKREEDDDENDGAESDEAIEADCVCKNTSFDVAMIGGLCAGCLAGNGGVNEDMSTIMSQCGFTTSSYAETATAMVANVTVVATKPTGTAAGATTGTATGSITRTAATGTTSATSTSTAGAGSGAATVTRVAGWILGVGAVMAWML